MGSTNGDNTSENCDVEALERTLHELEVLEAIYGTDDDHEEGSSFSVLSPDSSELNRIRLFLGLLIQDENDNPSPDGSIRELPESLHIQVQTSVGDRRIEIRFRLPKGYPEEAPAVASSVRVTPIGLKRSRNDELISALNAKAESMLGSEAILDLVEETKEILESYQTLHPFEESNDSKPDRRDVSKRCRLWIWVHHITSKDRRKSILEEANDRGLSGILKYGYPGVVLAEGSLHDCESFVVWIKGNKSRPGGFGRNWGHHVRGQIEYTLEDERSTNPSTTFVEMEDLSEMSKVCKEMGLEDEFKEYVMQHK